MFNRASSVCAVAALVIGVGTGLPACAAPMPLPAPAPTPVIAETVQRVTVAVDVVEEVKPAKLAELEAIARREVAATAFATMDVARMRGHRLGDSFVRDMLWGHLFKRSDFDVREHVQWSLSAGSELRSGKGFMVVLQHTATPAQVATIRGVIYDWTPKSLDTPRRRYRYRRVVLSAPTPNLLVISLPEHGPSITRSLRGYEKGFILPEGQPAIGTRADNAAELLAPLRLNVPSTIGKSAIVLHLDGGGARLEMEGTSTTAEQAIADAAAVNALLRDVATSRFAGKTRTQELIVDLLPTFEASGTSLRSALDLSSLDLILLQKFHRKLLSPRRYKPLKRVAPATPPSPQGKQPLPAPVPPRASPAGQP